jgi:hypothetical protein
MHPVKQVNPAKEAHYIIEQIIYHLGKKYIGMGVAGVRRLIKLEEGNVKLQQNGLTMLCS